MNVKKEKGAITVFVLIACMFILIIVLLMNIGLMNKKTNQEKKLDTIVKNYAVEEEDLANVYAEIADKNEYPTKAEVEQMIEDRVPVHETMEVVPMNGVQIRDWKIVEKIGHIVVVNMSFTVDTSKLPLSTNVNKRTVVIKNFPIPKTGNAYLNGFYTISEGNGNTAQPISAVLNEKGELEIQVSGGDKAYTSRIWHWLKWHLFSEVE